MMYSKYRVRPFSGKKYHDNSGRCPTGTLSCAICGKPVKLHTHQHWAVVIDGGSNWGDADSDENDGGYMGAWPVGNDCHVKHVSREGSAS